MKHLAFSLLLSCSFAIADEHGDPPVRAPFKKGEDSLCVNDWWNRPIPTKVKARITDLKVPRDQVVAFGIYTVSNKTLKLSAQLYPLYPKETRTVRLEVKQDGKWKEIARENVHDLGWSALFRVENWPADKDIAYRIRHGKEASFEGLVRKAAGPVYLHIVAGVGFHDAVRVCGCDVVGGPVEVHHCAVVLHHELDAHPPGEVEDPGGERVAIMEGVLFR